MPDPTQPVYTSPRSPAHLRDILSKLQQNVNNISGTITDVFFFPIVSAAAPFTAGDAVYSNSGVITKAQANANNPSKVFGFVSQDIGTGDDGTVQDSGYVTRPAWGLTPGALYYLSPSVAGAITPTAPTTAGQYVVEVGKAVSSTVLAIEIQQRILL